MLFAPNNVILQQDIRPLQLGVVEILLICQRHYRHRTISDRILGDIYRSRSEGSITKHGDESLGAYLLKVA